MKTISANTTGNPKWNNKLVNDLAFIRQQLRYPFSIKNIYPFLFFPLVIAVFVGFAMDVSENHPGSITAWKRLIPSSVMVAASVITLWRYFQTLKLVSIPTNFYSTQNQQILKQFLEAQHLLVFRHPDASEVFQIASQAIDTIKDEREVLIFIVDDKRILINSHFTYTSKINFYSGKRHYKQMARMLKEWIAGHSVSNSMAVSI